ncbi:MAG: hypothetical protein V1740_06335 [Candidatus Woesearchaeota archaeon]
MTKSRKKGENWNWLQGGVMFVIIVVISLLVIKIFVVDNVPIINEQQIKNSCRIFYINNNVAGRLNAVPCASEVDCVEKDPDLPICCDMDPDDRHEVGEENFLGCCIPLDMASRCPTEKKRNAPDTGRLTGTTQSTAQITTTTRPTTPQPATTQLTTTQPTTT